MQYVQSIIDFQRKHSYWKLQQKNIILIKPTVITFFIDGCEVLIKIQTTRWFICHYNLSHSGRQLYRTAAPRRHVRESSNPTIFLQCWVRKIKNVHAVTISTGNILYITDPLEHCKHLKSITQTAKHSCLPPQSRERVWCGSWAHGWVGWSLHCGLWLWEGTWGRNSKESVTFQGCECLCVCVCLWVGRTSPGKYVYLYIEMWGVYMWITLMRPETYSL